MRFGYGPRWRRLALCSKQLIVLLGLLALPVRTRPEKTADAMPLPPTKRPSEETDPRIVRLKRFLSRLHCPVTYLAEDFISAADKNQLDWRLLPSISIIESGGGKAYRNNNIFGWDQGQHVFPTVRAGLNEVAFKLGNSPLYRHRDSVGKLRLYNPDEGYVGLVTTVMNRISPIEDLRPVVRVTRRSNEYGYVTN